MTPLPGLTPLLGRGAALGGLPHGPGGPDLGEGLEESGALRCPFLGGLHLGWLWGTGPRKLWVAAES